MQGYYFNLTVMFNAISDPTFHLLKSIILIAGIFLAFMLMYAKRYRQKDLEKKLTIILAVMAAISIGAFYNMGKFHFGGGVYHTHDLYHYYMGSKYFKEVGYLHLYDATIVADEESNNYMEKVDSVRDQSTYNFRSRTTSHQNKPEWRPKFTEERWSQFKKDLVWFQTHPHTWRWWKGIVGDFGYNPSPVWTMIAQALSLTVPAQDGYFVIIAYMDALLAAIMFYMIFRAFGLQTMLFSMVYWGCTYTFVFSFTGASFLRHDWIIYLMIGICLLKMQKEKLAAPFFALTTGLRVLPLIYMIQPAVKFLWDWKEEGRMNKFIFRFFIYLAASGIAIFILTLLTVAGGIDTWLAFYEKMKVHKQSWNTWNWGFVDIFIYQGEVYDNLPTNWKAIKEGRLNDFMPVIVTMQIITSIIFFRIAARLEYWEGICLGGFMFFLFFNPTKYYYVHLITLMPLFASRLEDSWRAQGIAMLFGITIFMHFLRSFNDTAILIQFVFCSLILIFYMTLFFLIYKSEKEKSADV